MANIIKSSYDKIQNQCLAQGKPWEDPDFPADATSIGPERSQYPIKWLRPHAICESCGTKPEFIFDDGDRFDILQGGLGDCWMLSALASLTTSPPLFKKVVPQDQSFQKDKYTGVFRFHFWKYGEWVEVLVDDRLPTQFWNLAYARCSPRNEFWVPLLEKAYAKFYGNYQRIQGGRPYEALTDFSGCLAQIVFNAQLTPKTLSKTLIKAVDRNSILSSNVNNQSAVERGLPTGHAYSITGVQKVELDNGVEICLIRVRNPWGNETEWTGKWSDSSEEWNQLTPKAKNALGYVNSKDGEFWMELTDFLENFDSLEICYLNPADIFSSPEKERCWSISTFHGQWIKDKTSGGNNISLSSYCKNPQFEVTLKDSDEDEDDMASFVVELTQMNRRRQHLPALVIGFYIYKHPPGEKLPLCREVLCNYNNFEGRCQYINARAVTKSFTVTPGTYVIIPTTRLPNEEAEFMLRVFSETDHTSHEV